MSEPRKRVVEYTPFDYGYPNDASESFKIWANKIGAELNRTNGKIIDLQEEIDILKRNQVQSTPPRGHSY